MRLMVYLLFHLIAQFPIDKRNTIVFIGAAINIDRIESWNEMIQLEFDQ